MAAKSEASPVDEPVPENEQLFPGFMYRRPKFLEILLEIRREMALEADYDVDLFAEMARSGSHAGAVKTHALAADKDLNGTNGKVASEHPRETKRTVKA
ncbi:MAG: hypothetical protein ABIV21_02630 [Pyrinomonadaceae bacterium]